RRRGSVPPPAQVRRGRTPGREPPRSGGPRLLLALGGAHAAGEDGDEDDRCDDEDPDDHPRARADAARVLRGGGVVVTIVLRIGGVLGVLGVLLTRRGPIVRALPLAGLARGGFRRRARALPSERVAIGGRRTPGDCVGTGGAGRPEALGGAGRGDTGGAAA